MSANFHTPLAEAFDQYYDLWKALRADFTFMLELKSDCIYKRRNTIRAAAAMFEGAAFGLGKVCLIADSLAETPGIEEIERDVLEDKKGVKSRARDRLMTPLLQAHRIFGIASPPSTEDEGWIAYMGVLRKRDALTHPKDPSSLQCSENEWDSYVYGMMYMLYRFSKIDGGMIDYSEWRGATGRPSTSPSTHPARIPAAP